MSPTQPLPPKKEVGLALLERSSVYVHLDPRQDAVVVPAWFKKQPQLVLQVGMNMPVPIPDLRFDDDGMSCTLSFNRAPFFCVVPWASVFAMVGEDGRGMVWPDDVPAEVARQAQGRGTDAAPRKDAARSPACRPSATRADAKAETREGRSARASARRSPRCPMATTRRLRRRSRRRPLPAGVCRPRFARSWPPRRLRAPSPDRRARSASCLRICAS